jgi:predicted phosphodiesterase
MSKFWSTDSSSSSSSDEENEESTQDAASIGEGEPATEGLSQDPNAAWERIKDKQIFREPSQSTNAKPPDCTRIVCISDTHGKHRDVHLPPGDILIHGGDFTKSGEPGTILDLSKYFQESGFEEVIVIPGNHDMTLHPEFYEEKWQRFHDKKFDCDLAQDSVKRCTYLVDSPHTTKDGIEVYGSPWSPEFYDWAFNLPRGAPIREVWNKIPEPTDVLITHGPPLGRGDLTPHSGRAGCYDLLVAVQERIKPRVHIFGHIHEGAGATFDGQVLYINASNLNVKYQAVNHPIVIDVPYDRSKPAMIVPPHCNMTPKDLICWCQDKKYNLIAEALEGCDLEALPSRNALVSQDTYEEVDYRLQLRLHGEYRQLRKALAVLYAQCFPR